MAFILVDLLQMSKVESDAGLKPLSPSGFCVAFVYKSYTDIPFLGTQQRKLYPDYTPIGISATGVALSRSEWGGGGESPNCRSPGSRL